MPNHKQEIPLPLEEIRNFYKDELARYGSRLGHGGLAEVDSQLLKSLSLDGSFAFKFLKGHENHALRQLETIKQGQVPEGVEHMSEKNLVADAKDYGEWAKVVGEHFGIEPPNTALRIKFTAKKFLLGIFK